MELLPVRADLLVTDDTSFRTLGTQAIGVARQYYGALGKIVNCQVIAAGVE